MGTETGLVGREPEIAGLTEALDGARRGGGGLVLVAGDAGMGKTRLAGELAARTTDAVVLRGAASNSAPTPYGPITAALRSHLRSRPGALSDCGPLTSHLALLLPELGGAAQESDRPTIFEAVRCALAQLAEDAPGLVLLDDLQWSDEATLELLAAIGPPLQEMPVLVVGAYRSDGLPRDHRLRWLRNELRRQGALAEVVLDPLDRDQTEALLGGLFAEPPSPALVGIIHDRAQGSPFFAQELARALTASDALRSSPRGLELVEEGRVPIPDTVRDAVLMGASGLSDDARAAAEAAATAGEKLDLALVEPLADAAGLAELVDQGILIEEAPGRAGFRHALTREALYAEIPWMRRRALHGSLAEALEAAGAPSSEIATHWTGAGDPEHAREAFVRAAEEFEALHAYRDAAKAGRQALEAWPEAVEEARRVELLERYAGCAERAGQLGEAAKAWRELAALRSAGGEREAFATAQRRMAAVCELRGEREQAFTARRLAAEAFESAGCGADAATEWLAMANHRRAGARYGEALELARAAADQAVRSDRPDLEARAMGVVGVAEARSGSHEQGLETIRAGLARAVELDLTGVAAELYQRLSLALYDSADYRRAQEALDEALGLCRATGDGDTEVACVTCLVYVLRERGEWAKAAEMGRDLIDSDTAVWVAEGLVGAIHAFQGKYASARRLLNSSRAVSSEVGHYNMYMDSTTSLACVAAGEDAPDEAAEHYRALLARWERSEDHHYAVWGLRRGAAFLARRGDRQGAHACTEALTRMASHGGHPDALAALAQAIGEAALQEGDADSAAQQLTRAVELHRGLEIPFERADIELRAGVAVAATGDRDQALELLGSSYRTARKLGARPLAAEAAAEVAKLGESVAGRLGRRAASDADGTGLTRRELEVLRHVSVGRTNPEIAQDLFLSPRTVDMHVRNILRKLDCRSRGEASHKAGELGLLI